MIIAFQFYNLSYPPIDINKEINENDKINFFEKINENSNERISEDLVINRISIDSDINKN